MLQRQAQPGTVCEVEGALIQPQVVGNRHLLSLRRVVDGLQEEGVQTFLCHSEEARLKNKGLRPQKAPRWTSNLQEREGYKQEPTLSPRRDGVPLRHCRDTLGRGVVHGIYYVTMLLLPLSSL